MRSDLDGRGGLFRTSTASVARDFHGSEPASVRVGCLSPGPDCEKYYRWPARPLARWSRLLADMLLSSPMASSEAVRMLMFLTFQRASGECQLSYRLLPQKKSTSEASNTKGEGTSGSRYGTTKRGMLVAGARWRRMGKVAREFDTVTNFDHTS